MSKTFFNIIFILLYNAGDFTVKVIFVSLSPPWTHLSGVQKEAFYWPVAFLYQCEGPASPK